MGALDDLLAKGQAKAKELEGAPAAGAPAAAPPAADTYGAGNLPPIPDFVGKGLDLAQAGSDEYAKLHGIHKDAASGKWVPDTGDEGQPWYKRAGHAIGNIASGAADAAKGAGQSALAGLPAFSAAAVRGATGGLANDAVAKALEYLPGGDVMFGKPVSAHQLQEASREVAKGHEVADTLGDVVGSGALAAATGPASGASTAARVAGNTANSLGQYALRNVTDTDADKPWLQRAKEGMQHAVENPVGLGIAAATPALAEGVSHLAGAGAQYAKNKAKDLFSHLFMPAPQRSKLIEAEGPNAVRDLVGRAQDAGLLSSVVPTAGNITQRAAELAHKVGPQIGDQLDKLLAAAKQHGGTADTTALVKALQDKADDILLHNPTRVAPEKIAALQTAIDGINTRTLSRQGGLMALDRAVGMLKQFQEGTNFNPQVEPPKAIDQAINMAGYKGLKDATRGGFDALEQAGQLPAGEYQKYQDLQKLYHTAKQVHYPALQVSEKLEQASSADPGDLLKTALAGGSLLTPRQIGVSGGMPRGIAGRAVQGIGGLLSAVRGASDIAEKFKVPETLAGITESSAKAGDERTKVRNESARQRLHDQLESAGSANARDEDIQKLRGVLK